jgi:hypothetical protein
MKSITEGMRHRKRIVTYAIRHNNNAQAARKYHTTRQYVSYWRKRYDGTLESLRKQSRRPMFIRINMLNRNLNLFATCIATIAIEVLLMFIGSVVTKAIPARMTQCADR